MRANLGGGGLLGTGRMQRGGDEALLLDAARCDFGRRKLRNIVRRVAVGVVAIVPGANAIEIHRHSIVQRLCALINVLDVKLCHGLDNVRRHVGNAVVFHALEQMRLGLWRSVF